MKDKTAIRIGSRGSALALVQANWVADRLREQGTPTEIVIIRTAGDDRAPDTAWGEGAFVTTIEQALISGRVDVAVHSAKDVPTDEGPLLTIAAWTRREDPRDALVCRVRGTTLATLAQGARVGTDSPRRSAFLRAHRTDLQIHPLSGNVDTRLRKLDEGESDALVLAVAGLTRLGRADRIDEILPLEVAIPAPGQGTLALQTRADDNRARRALAPLDDPASRVAVQAERAFLAATGGGCRSPIGALGEVTAGVLTLHVAAESRGGVVRITESIPQEQWPELAQALAERIVRARALPRVLVTRPEDGATDLLDALDRAGLDVVHVPAIEIVPETSAELDAAVSSSASARAWIVATSPNGVGAALGALDRTSTEPASARWAVVGRASATLLEQRGVRAFVPSRALGATLAAELPIATGDRVLVVRGDIADTSVPDVLRERGGNVVEQIAYRTVEGPGRSRARLAAAMSAPFDVLIIASGSAVRGLLALAPSGSESGLRATPAVCIGPSTAAVAREHGFASVIESRDPGTDSMVDAVVGALGRQGTTDEPGRTLTPAAATPAAAGGSR